MSHEQFSECIDACTACALACEHCASACLDEKGVSELVECIRLNRDCAELCLLASAWMARGSRFASLMGETCAIVCNACAEECAKFPTSHCQVCASACRQCAEICRRIVGGAVPEPTTSIGPTG